MGKKCIACGVELDDNAMFCNSCGKKQTEEKRQADQEQGEKKKKCIACGMELNDNAIFCKSCGKKQIVEKRQVDPEEERKKKLIVYGLAVVVIGIVFIRCLSEGNLLMAVFLTAFLVFGCMALYFSGVTDSETELEHDTYRGHQGEDTGGGGYALYG